jgi:copper type II ascorbate-dependent monooxygenase-like protein
MNIKRSVTLLLLAMALTIVCAERRTSVRSNPETITFNNQVVRLLQKKCQVCHHDGDIAPFSLMTYIQAKLFGETMREAVEAQIMPPWKAVDDCVALSGVTRLTAEERGTIAQWIEQGSPEGDPADLPPPLQFDDSSWPLGEPDVILQPDKPFVVGIGDDLYRCFSLPADLRGDRFIAAIDVKPEARSIVHHAIVYLDADNESKRLDDADPLPGFQCPNDVQFAKKSPVFWWVPGQPSQLEPEGTGWLIPRGISLVLKVHYHVHHGTGGSDRTSVGLYFARKPVTKQLRVLTLINNTFTIPPDNANYEISASAAPMASGGDVHALGIAPHMQLLGHDMEIDAQSSEGALQCLLGVDDWDAHWQRFYQFQEPVAVSAGTKLSLTAHYNNSRSNPDNPFFPLIDVHPGETTSDETCIAFIKYTLDSENRQLSSPQINSVSIDGDNRLVVKGRGFSVGAEIMIDGQRVRDTVNHKKKGEKRLNSESDWRRLATRGQQAAIIVLNADGVSSPSVSFTR